MLADVRRAFEEIAATRGTAGKESTLKALLAGATALEAKYILKIITGDLRIGLKESLVEEAIAKTYGEPAALVQRANMLLGDIGETLLLAADHRLGDARMRLFHPIGFMLASPAADTTEAFEYFQHARVEDKYDGIRAQAHCAEGKVRLFSRTLDDVTRSFPELVGPLSEFPGDAILDGEIVAWKYNELGGHAMPFTEIQKRLGRKQVDQKMIGEAPVAYVVFDVLYAARRAFARPSARGAGCRHSIACFRRTACDHAETDPIRTREPAVWIRNRRRGDIRLDPACASKRSGFLPTARDSVR